jgi:hypothetical protein
MSLPTVTCSKLSNGLSFSLWICRCWRSGSVQCGQGGVAGWSLSIRVHSFSDSSVVTPCPLHEIPILITWGRHTDWHTDKSNIFFLRSFGYLFLSSVPYFFFLSFLNSFFLSFFPYLSSCFFFILSLMYWKFTKIFYTYVSCGGKIRIKLKNKSRKDTQIKWYKVIRALMFTFASENWALSRSERRKIGTV